MFTVQEAGMVDVPVSLSYEVVARLGFDEVVTFRTPIRLWLVSRLRPKSAEEYPRFPSIPVPHDLHDIYCMTERFRIFKSLRKIFEF
jgi:hypothetical protein